MSIYEVKRVGFNWNIFVTNYNEQNN